MSYARTDFNEVYVLGGGGASENKSTVPPSRALTKLQSDRLYNSTSKVISYWFETIFQNFSLREHILTQLQKNALYKIYTSAFT